MSATDFTPLFTAAGTTAKYYTRSFGGKDSETQWKKVTWTYAADIRVIMYRLSNRTEDTPDTRGVTEQRWMLISQTAVAKDNRVVVGSESYIIDTEPSVTRIGGVVIAYSCELVREFLSTGILPSGSPLVPPPTPPVITGPLGLEEPYSYLIWEDDGVYYAKNGRTTNVTSNANSTALLQSVIDALRATYPSLGQRDCSGEIFIKGFLPITTPINLTEARNLKITGLSSKPMFAPGWDYPSSGFDIRITGSVVFDLTNSVGIQFENLSFIVNELYIPTAVILTARIPDGYQVGNLVFRDCVFNGDSSAALVYIYGSEVNLFENVIFNAKRRAVIITKDNFSSIASPFQPLIAIDTSTNENDFVKCFFDHPSYYSPSGELIYIGGAWEPRFDKCFFNGSNLYAFKLSNDKPVINLQLQSCHFENGGIATIDENIYGVFYHYGFIIKDCLVTCLNLPDDIVIDFDKNNIIIRGFYLDTTFFNIPTTYIKFWSVQGSYIRLDENCQPLISFSEQFQWSILDVFYGALVTAPNIPGSTVIIRELGAESWNSGMDTITGGGAGPWRKAVTHGCGFTPDEDDITVTPTNNPTNDPGHIWIDGYGTTTFNVNCHNDPGESGMTFSWTMKKRPG